jgi:hypothetical protein
MDGLKSPRHSCNRAFSKSNPVLESAGRFEISQLFRNNDLFRDQFPVSRHVCCLEMEDCLETMCGKAFEQNMIVED